MLPDATRREAANLLNQLDLLVRRKFPKLGEPWQLNLRQLWQWREHLVAIAGTLEEADRIAQGLLVDPFALCGLEAPQAAEPTDSEEDGPLPLPLTPFHESLLDFALQEYVAVEEDAKTEGELEDAKAELIERIADRQSMIDAFSSTGRAVPENLTLEMQELLELAAEVEANESSEGETETASAQPEEGDDTQEAPEIAEDDEAVALTMEEREVIYREGYADAMRLLKLAMANLGEWVRNEPARFRDTN